MPAGTIVVLPDPAGVGASALAALLEDRIAQVLPPVEGEQAAARAAVAIAALAPPPPLTLVACGAATLLLPALARAQRAAHRRVEAYLLIDGAPPPTDDDWPDAPVFVAGDAAWARLRGWTVVDDLAGWIPA